MSAFDTEEFGDVPHRKSPLRWDRYAWVVVIVLLLVNIYATVSHGCADSAHVSLSAAAQKPIVEHLKAKNAPHKHVMHPHRDAERNVKRSFNVERHVKANQARERSFKRAHPFRNERHRHYKTASELNPSQRKWYELVTSLGDHVHLQRSAKGAKLGPEAEDAVALAIEHVSHLESLSMPVMDAAGVHAIANALVAQGCGQLHQLSLFGPMGEAGGRFLGHALGHCKELVSLNLGNAKLGDKGAEAIIKALPSLDRLRTLLLNSDGLSDRSGRLLASLLDRPDAVPHLTFISLIGNNMSLDVDALVAKHQKSRPHLRINVM